MRKTARLDQILVNLGYTGREQITRALAHQRARGGRLGMCLVETGAITVRQLLAALSEQYRLPSTIPTASDVPPELLQRIPRELVFDNLILPLSWDRETASLTLAVGSPDDQQAIDRVKEIFGARVVQLQLAPDSHLLEIGSRLLGSQEAAEEPHPEAPEVFPVDEGQEEEGLHVEDGVQAKRVLMVTENVTGGKMLPPVFHREGVDLVIATDARETADALGASGFDNILVSEQMAGQFSGWVKSRTVPVPKVEVTAFRSISRAFLENPVPYETIVRSLKAAVQALADSRCAILDRSPPYGLIASDLEALARRHKLRRVVVDGLQLASHLLIPGPVGPETDPIGSSQPFESFASSLELASRFRFPWPLDRVLNGCHALFSGRKAKAGVGVLGREMRLAAQLLALVWYRHNHLPSPDPNANEAMSAFRSALRKKTSRLAPLEVVEAYLRLMADGGGALAGGVDRQALLVGGHRLSSQLGPELTGAGCQTVSTSELADAQTLAERRPPGAIVLDFEEFPPEGGHFAQLVRAAGPSFLFVLTDSTDPALVLKLLDIGVDDVFGPPHDFRLLAARINRAIRSKAKRPT